MHRQFLAALLTALAAAAVAGESGERPHVDAIVPADTHEHERLHWFGRRDHHLVPGP